MKSNETEDYMPSAIYYSHKLLRTIMEDIKSSKLKGVGPYAKSQITLKYKNGKPIFSRFTAPVSGCSG